ncbi:MAG: TIGR03905 family TSCPD domain-containing protein [Clostridia bacterium]|nr:TIGR03905 family TSCPD domain-containing protein [Clostridia bacterium]MBR0444254.1 TIGR03905 family TSCPD domain-containing protein [Clostridia bacterium]
MHYTYYPHNVCSSKIDFDLDHGTVRNIAFVGGCNGNLKAISKLCEGMEAEKLIGILKGNLCGRKNTSCADQLANAVEQAMQG